MCAAQAGSDSLLTSATFLKLAKTFFKGVESMDGHRDVLYGELLDGSVTEMLQSEDLQRFGYSGSCSAVTHPPVRGPDWPFCFEFVQHPEHIQAFCLHAGLGTDGINEITIHD